jgi:hypothetical protein
VPYYRLLINKSRLLIHYFQPNKAKVTGEIDSNGYFFLVEEKNHTHEDKSTLERL